MAIRGYADRGTRDIAENVNSKAARQKLPSALHDQARRRLVALDAATQLDDLCLPGMNLHALSRDREDQFAIRINRQYRICFRWLGKDAGNVEITDYH